MNKWALFAVGVGLIGIGYFFREKGKSRQQPVQLPPRIASEFDAVYYPVMEDTRTQGEIVTEQPRTPKKWVTPDIGDIRNGEKVIYSGVIWEPDFIAATRAKGLPDGLLSRVAWQESRYNPEAYNMGSTATGMMQIVPRWHPNVDASNPKEAIPYAAGYLAALKYRFGSWSKALAAYNWGPGNLAKLMTEHPKDWIGYVPRETSKYVIGVINDTGLGL